MRLVSSQFDAFLYDACQFGACQYDAIPVRPVSLCFSVSLSDSFLIFMLIQYAISLLRGQLVRTNFGVYLFFCIFLSAKKCCLRQFGAYCMLLSEMLNAARLKVILIEYNRFSLIFTYEDSSKQTFAQPTRSQVRT